MSASIDPPSPESLFEHADFLRALARRLVDDPSTADDLLQETYVSAIEKPPHGIRKLRPWLAGVLRNVARERARGEGRRARREKDAARSEALPGTVEIVERIEAFRDLARDVVRLEEPYRTTILLRFFEGITAEEIAEREGVPAATVRSRQKRALEKLRERLDRRHGDRRSWCLLLVRALGDERLRPALATSGLVSGLALCVGLAAAVLVVSTLARSPTVPAEAVEIADLAREPRADALERSSANPPVEPGADREALASQAPSRAVADARSPLRLRLYDVATGEPLARFVLEASAPGHAPERIESDDDGRVTSTTTFAHGAVGLYLIDHPALAAWREVPRTSRPLRWTVAAEHRGSEHELRLAVGPTWTLDVDAPAPDELEVVLYGSDASAPLAECVAPLRAPVRAGGLPWVRFSSEVGALSGAQPWRLELRSKDGFRRGAADVATGAARSEDPVRIVLEPTGVVHVEPATTAGTPVAATITLDGPGGTRTAQAATHHEFGWLAPGAYLVRARVAGESVRATDVTVEVRANEVVRARTVHAVSSGIARAIRGAVTAESGRLAPDVRICARDDAQGLVFHAELAVDADGERGTYSFDDLPAGSYVFSASSRSVYRWRATRTTVAPPAEDVDFVAVDGGATEAIVFRAFDAETGLEIPEVEVLLVVDGDEAARSRTTSQGAVSFVGVPIGARLDWTVCAQGYRLARGAEVDLTDRGQRREGYVRLARGFEREVRVRAGLHGAPLAGAVVRADGRAVATTDAHGIVRLSLDEPPRAIEVEGAIRMPALSNASFRAVYVQPRR